MSTMKCLACPKELHKSELLKCVTCSGTFHFQCINMTSAYFRDHFHDLNKIWRCPSCENVTSRRKGTDTPVRHQFVGPDTISQLDMSCDDSSTPETPNEPIPTKSDVHQGVISYQQFAALLDSKIEYMKNCLSKEIRNEINCALEKLRSDFTATTDFLSGQICDLNKEIKSCKTKFYDLECENLSLQKTVRQLQIELNVREQSNLATDIQITGIPEFENESLMHLVTTAAAKIGVSIKEHDIVSLVRVGPKRAASAASAVDASSAAHHSFRSRPIVVRLMRRATRDELLKNARVRRGSTTGDLGLPSHEPRRFYINERLTKINRQIFIKAREAARTVRWRFVWTKEGRIYARRSESSEVHLLQTEDDIERLLRATDTASIDA